MKPERFVILTSVLLGFGCGLPLSFGSPSAAPTGASPPSPLAPTVAPVSTEVAAHAPTRRAAATPSPAPPTAAASTAPASPATLPLAGRLLIKTVAVVEPATAGAEGHWFEQGRWLALPNLAVLPHPGLAAAYPQQIVNVSLSPDRAHVAYESRVYAQAGGSPYGAASVSVLLAPAEGGQALPVSQAFSDDSVAANASCGGDFNWSAQGRTFAFGRNSHWGPGRSAPTSLFVYSLASSQLRTIALQARQPVAFALSPDGGRIAFTAVTAEPELFMSLYLINADGSGERLLVPGLIGSNLVWHPDGTRLFAINGKPELGLYSYDVATGAATLLTRVSDRAYCLGLSPDGTVLTYDENGVMLLDSAGGEPLRVTDSRNFIVIWSPDSRYYAFIADLNTVQVVDRFGSATVLTYNEAGMQLIELFGWFP